MIGDFSKKESKNFNYKKPLYVKIRLTEDNNSLEKEFKISNKRGSFSLGKKTQGKKIVGRECNDNNQGKNMGKVKKGDGNWIGTDKRKSNTINTVIESRVKCVKDKTFNKGITSTKRKITLPKNLQLNNASANDTKINSSEILNNSSLPTINNKVNQYKQLGQQLKCNKIKSQNKNINFKSKNTTNLLEEKQYKRN